MELIVGGKTLAEVKIQRGIFQGDALLPLQFLIVMMSLNYILRGTGGYEFTKSQEKINYLIYMDDINLSAENKKELEILIQTIEIDSQDIKMEFGFEKCAMLIMRNGTRQITEGIKQPNQERIKRLRGKENYKYLGILEVNTIKQEVMKEKNNKRLLPMNEKAWMHQYKDLRNTLKKAKKD